MPRQYDSKPRYTDSHGTKAAHNPVRQSIQHPENMALCHEDLSKLMVDMQPPNKTRASPINIALFSTSSSKTPPTIKTATRSKPDTLVCGNEA
jgi:hypothetical protein|tara:strand:- start:234 stop:512 length:279 start_codon:yes stop_codon:yes gene_type:complete